MQHQEDEEQLTFHVRSQLNIDIHSGEFTTNIHGVAPKNADKFVPSDDIQVCDSQPGPSAPKQKKSRAKTSDATYDGLIGQANLFHVRGNSNQAINFLNEAIKLSPYDVTAYRHLADIYNQLGQVEKAFEFRLLSGLLNHKTPAEEWVEISEEAKSFGRMELAVASLAKAIRASPTDWQYYDKRIILLESLGDTELAMKTRLQAAQTIDCHSRGTNMNFTWIDSLIKTAADYFCSLKDEDKATEALETFILRSREFGRPIDVEHLALLGMWMNKGHYVECIKSILALHPGIQANDQNGEPIIMSTFTSTGFVVSPFPDDPSTIHWVVEDAVNTSFLSHLIVSFIYTKQILFASRLIIHLLKRGVHSNQENHFIDVARAFHTNGNVDEAFAYVERLKQKPELAENSDIWFLCGLFLQTLNRPEEAEVAYRKVLDVQPGHIDTRINLSTILQQIGKADEALETLKDVNLDSCSQLPDERLLVRQAEVLKSQKGSKDQYLRCLRMLLIPHFYVIHRLGEEVTRVTRRINIRAATLNSELMKCALNAIRGGELEKVVKRLGYVAFFAHRITDDLSGAELHQYAFRLAEQLYFHGKFKEMFHVICYSLLHPKIIEQGSSTFLHLLLFGSIKAEEFCVAFEFARYFLQTLMNGKVENNALIKRVHTALNFVFCRQQHVNYHRFIMRQVQKYPENDELRIISGNNSLVTGAYRHSLGEYYRCWLHDRENPMLNFLIALTFTHIASKKDVTHRNFVALRAIGFMKRYQKFRGPCQEVFYNIGRMCHQMGILSSAMHFYEKVLYKYPVPTISYEHPETGETVVEQTECYSLRRHAAYNLSLIYEASGNREMACSLLAEFCTF